MTFWEYQSAIEGWMIANNPPEKSEASYPTDQEFEDALRRLH